MPRKPPAATPNPAAPEPEGPPPKLPGDVAAIWKEIGKLLNTSDADGRKPFNTKYGVYVFYDYDGEPIYVGQTAEQLRTRIRRHLTNQRTDAVAMNVLDPFEVADIEVYPFYDLEAPAENEDAKAYKARADATLAAAEYAVFEKVLAQSALKAVLNEKDIPPKGPVELPTAFRGRIIPAGIYEERKHPDVRLARRAGTVANLARVISERDVSPGLRRTLLTQARRLEKLARERFEDFAEAVPAEAPGEETGTSETDSK